MTVWCPIRVLRTAGVALLPAVALLCCAGGADAGCGDYVRLIGPDGGIQGPAGHEPMPTERPCQGPECTGGPKAPAPVPSAPPAPTQDVKGLAIDASRPPQDHSTSRPVSDADASPIRPSRSIFRPPRASS